MTITEHEGIDVGYCSNCGYKKKIYKIAMGMCVEMRLCKKCLQMLQERIDLHLKSEEKI